MKDKKIEFASTDWIEQFRRIADDFMLEIFDFVPEFGSSDTAPIWSRITKVYAIERTDVPSERLVDLFAQIEARRNLQ